MHVSGSTNVSSATPDSNPTRAIAAYSALTAMCHAHRFRRGKAEVEGVASLLLPWAAYRVMIQANGRNEFNTFAMNYLG